MMKLLLLLLFPLSLFSQNIYKGIVTYQIKLDPVFVEKYKNSLDRKKMKPKMRVTFDNMYLYSKVEEGILRFNQFESLYRLTPQLKNDYETQTINLVKLKTGADYIIYYNYFTKEKLQQNCTLIDKCYLIKKSLNKWIITQEFKKIQGYLCFKAVIKVKKADYIIAWFTPDIPVNFGPNGYNGLPGLILELKQGDFIYNVQKIKLNPLEDVLIKKPTGFNINEKEFQTLFWKSMNVKF